MKSSELQTQFYQQTKTEAVNSQGEFDIDYVAWLENKITLGEFIEQPTDDDIQSAKEKAKNFLKASSPNDILGYRADLKKYNLYNSTIYSMARFALSFTKLSVSPKSESVTRDKEELKNKLKELAKTFVSPEVEEDLVKDIMRLLGEVNK